MSIQPVPQLLQEIDAKLATSTNDTERYGLALARWSLDESNYVVGSEERRSLYRITKTSDVTLTAYRKRIEKIPGGAAAYAHALLTQGSAIPSFKTPSSHCWRHNWPAPPDGRRFTLLNTLHHNLPPLSPQELKKRSNVPTSLFYAKVLILETCCSGRDDCSLNFTTFCEAVAGCTRVYGDKVPKRARQEGLLRYLADSWQEARDSVRRNPRICEEVERAVHTALSGLSALMRPNEPDDWPSEEPITGEDLDRIHGIIHEERKSNSALCNLICEALPDGGASSLFLLPRIRALCDASDDREAAPPNKRVLTAADSLSNRVRNALPDEASSAFLLPRIDALSNKKN